MVNAQMAQEDVGSIHLRYLVPVRAVPHTIRVSRRHDRPTQRPEKLVADRGDDRQAFRAAQLRRGIGMCIPPKRRLATWRAKRGRPVVARKEDYRQRYKVERGFAWLGTFRRRLIR